MYNLNSEEKKKEKNAFLRKYGGIIFISTILGFFILLALFNFNFGQWLANIVLWFYNESGNFGIYLGIFLISIFGNFTVIFPVPYTIALIVISAIIPGVNPILLGLVGGFGASLGEVTAWGIGRGSKGIIGESEKIDRMKRYIDKGWAPLLIFLFAATPLPDDAFLIVLGIVQYSIYKALIYCFIGKFVLCFLCSALPIWLAATPLGNFLFGLFGIDLLAAKTGTIPPSTPLEILRSSLLWAGTIIILFLLVYIDWSKIIKKIKKKPSKKAEVN